MLINSPENGATEVPGTSNDSLFVFLAGPIRHWWTPGVEGSALHDRYMKIREVVHFALSADFLVYAPHRAWRGPWNQVAQEVNDLGIALSDAVVWINVHDITAEGTWGEIELARKQGKPVYCVEIVDEHHSSIDILDQLVEIKTQLFKIKPRVKEEI